MEAARRKQPFQYTCRKNGQKSAGSSGNALSDTIGHSSIRSHAKGNTVTMRRIVRLTLVYSTYEDRLQWRVVDGEGVTLRLWLTQRLCNMLVKAVLNVLDKTVEPAPLPAEQANVPVSSPHGAALPQAKNQTHYWEQTMADMAKAPAQAV